MCPICARPYALAHSFVCDIMTQRNEDYFTSINTKRLDSTVALPLLCLCIVQLWEVTHYVGALIRELYDDFRGK